MASPKEPPKDLTFSEFFDMHAEDHNIQGVQPHRVTIGWMKLVYFITRNIIIPLGLTPHQIEILGVISALLTIFLYAFVPFASFTILLILFFFIAILTIFAGMTDNIDGAVARWTNEKHPAGSYEDLVYDRIIDFLLFIGPLFSRLTTLLWGVLGISLVFLFEALRSIHMTLGVPMHRTLVERQIRLAFQSAFPLAILIKVILWEILHKPTSTVFLPYDYFYVFCGIIGLIGIIQTLIRIGSNYSSESIIRDEMIKSEEGQMEELSKYRSNAKLYDKLTRFNAIYLTLINLLYIPKISTKNIYKQYIQGRVMRFTIVKPIYLFLILLFGLISMIIVRFFWSSVSNLNLYLFIFVLLSISSLSLLKKIMSYASYTRFLTLRDAILANFFELFLIILFLVNIFLHMESWSQFSALFFIIILLLSRNIEYLSERFKLKEIRFYITDNTSFWMIFSIIGVYIASVFLYSLILAVALLVVGTNLFIMQLNRFRLSTKYMNENPNLFKEN